jgi:hypothetical protein
MTTPEARIRAIAVLFSGGSDSTLAAALAAERAQSVHLISYAHPFMFFHEKIDINIPRLRDTFPLTSFEIYRENITPLYRRLYLRRHLRNVARHGTMLVPHLCGACKLAMHYATVAYCRPRGITHVYCGAHEESSRVFPAQMKPVIEDTQRMYARHGVTYEVPVYHAGRTDRTIHELGIIDNPNMKDQHLFYTTQHTCPIGALVHIYCRLYGAWPGGAGRYRRTAHAMVRELIEETEAAILGADDREDTGDEQRWGFLRGRSRARTDHRRRGRAAPATQAPRGLFVPHRPVSSDRGPSGGD